MPPPRTPWALASRPEAALHKPLPLCRTAHGADRWDVLSPYELLHRRGASWEQDLSWSPASRNHSPQLRHAAVSDGTSHPIPKLSKLALPSKYMENPAIFHHCNCFLLGPGHSHLWGPYSPFSIQSNQTQPVSQVLPLLKTLLGFPSHFK